MDKHELEAMTKEELIKYAADHDVEVHQSWLKDDIIKEILKAEKAAAKADPAKTTPGPAQFDSNKQREENTAKIRAENKEDAENQEIANFAGLPQEGETREQLLARIRKMREAPPKEKEAEPFRSESTMKEFNAEQEAGKAAVAKATEQQEKYREHLQKQEAGEKNQAR